MTFNIEYGGDGVSFDSVIQTVKLANPDVVGVNEPGKHLPKLADALGWKYYDEERQIISKYPIQLPADNNPRYSYVEVTPGGYIAVADVHLPSSPAGPNVIYYKDFTLKQVLKVEEKNRVPEAKAALENLQWTASQGVPSFMMGDFNSPSHLDWTQEMVGARPQIKFAVEWPVTKMLENAGLSDSYRVIYPDPKIDPGITWPAMRPKIKGEWNPSKRSLADRIDMIWSGGPATPTDSWVMGEQGADVKETVSPWPSDHRALVSTFDVSPAPIPQPRPFVTPEPALLTTGKPLAVTTFSDAPDATVAVVKSGGDPASAVAQQPVADGTPVEGFAPAVALQFDTSGWKTEAHDVVLVAGGKELARQTFWVRNPGDKVQLITSKKTYRPGEPIKVSWYGAPANRWDWIGIYERGADNHQYGLWVYTKSAVAGTYAFGSTDPGPWPLDPGEYSARYLLNDGYKSVAEADFTVK